MMRAVCSSDSPSRTRVSNNLLPSDCARLNAPIPASQMCCADSVIDFGLSAACGLPAAALRGDVLPAGLLAGLAVEGRTVFFSLAMWIAPRLDDALGKMQGTTMQQCDAESRACLEHSHHALTLQAMFNLIQCAIEARGGFGHAGGRWKVRNDRTRAIGNDILAQMDAMPGQHRCQLGATQAQVGQCIAIRQLRDAAACGEAKHIGVEQFAVGGVGLEYRLVDVLILLRVARQPHLHA